MLSFFMPMSSSKYLIAGLGNPGEKYTATRHNIGFQLIDHLADQYGLNKQSSKMRGVSYRGRLWGKQVILLKPQTFMNKSGESVRQYLDYYDIERQDLLVIHDDIDLHSGRVKVVAKGGAGGHNGIRSIINHLGSNVFARLKVGVGRPCAENGIGDIPVDKYVLSRFSKDEVELLEQRAGVVEEAVELFMTEGVDSCMNQINGREG